MDFTILSRGARPPLTPKSAVKVLGPTAAYFSVGVKGFTQQQVANVSKILAKARWKLGPRLQEAGAVAPRVLAAVLEAAADTEDPLTQEYLAGAVAAARSPQPDQGFAAAYVRLIARLSPAQLRFHYALYRAFCEAGDGSRLLEAPVPGRRRALRCFIPYSNLLVAFRDEAAADAVALEAVLAGLDREGLIAPDYKFAGKTVPQRPARIAERLGLCATPSVRGWLLFFNAHGLGGAPPDAHLRATLARRPLSEGAVFPDATPMDVSG